MTVEVFRLKLQVRVELGDRLPKCLAVPNDLAHGRLIVRLQQVFESLATVAIASSGADPLHHHPELIDMAVG